MNTTLLSRIRDDLAETATRVVPWFFEQLPPAYFEATPQETMATHLRAIVGAKASDQPLSLVLQSEQGRVWTFIHDTDRTGLLLSLLDQLPRGRALVDAQVFTAKDGSLVLDVFRFAGAAAAGSPAIADLAAELLGRLQDPEDTFAFLEPQAEAGAVLAALVAGGVDARSLLSRTVRYLSARGVSVLGAQVHAEPGIVGSGIAVAGAAGSEASAVVLTLAPSPALEVPGLVDELRRLAWADPRAIALATSGAADQPSLSVAEVEVGLADLAYHRLAAIDPYRFARGRVAALCARHAAVVRPIAAALASGATWQPPKALDGLDSDAREAVLAWLAAAGAVRHHNLGRRDRYGLAMRVDPALLHVGRRAELEQPYALLYFSARGLMGFHVRFRNIARGGLRVVRPGGADAHVGESERLYDECWGLANAQQLKNKDIPEGGSKGVILAEPGAEVARLVKAVGDGIIDLCLLPPGSAETDRIYLGPDENISDALIEWLVARAHQRGYPVPDSFMSSKPGAGINHKQYGVTSEGVVLFLRAALAHVGLDPRKAPVRLTLTGGPDGDVAGNALRILHRDYGEAICIVGIADGSGAGEDPAGLHWPELLRLVAEGRGIAEFDREKLTATGRVLGVDEPGGVEARNSLPFRLDADALLPCGGRPGTIHRRNWRELLRADGSPRVRAIVEGANLFVTAEARRALDLEAGVVIVKDSSANKCGVICSSFEIAAAQLVDSETFLAIKAPFVEQVLERLRALAAREARLLFRSQARRPGEPLSEVSTRLSVTINRVSDAIGAGLESTDGPEVQRLVCSYLPESLVAAAGDAAIRALPAPYLRQVVATALASDLVYREGPEFVEGLGEPALLALALRYLGERSRIESLADSVLASGLRDAEEIAHLLREGGPRAAMEHPRG